MNPPIYNPVVPFNSGLTLYPGFMVCVTGTPIGGKFDVNFKTGHEPSSNVALHFQPRFDEGNIVVRTNRIGGHWEKEERQSNRFPFVMGKSFEIIFLCQQHQFKIAVNGRHFLEYRHRINIQDVKVLNIGGAVKLSLIRFDQEAVPRQPAPILGQAPKLIHNPGVPCKAVVPFNNIKNRKVVINGSPENRHPHRIGINLQAAGANPNIFFHFNPRFQEQTIVRNARLNGSWGTEERQVGVPFPFQYGVPYQLIIHVDQQSFRVELNGMLICTFNHRQRPLNLIREVSISGNTSISRISFE